MNTFVVWLLVYAAHPTASYTTLAQIATQEQCEMMRSGIEANLKKTPAYRTSKASEAVLRCVASELAATANTNDLG